MRSELDSNSVTPKKNFILRNLENTIYKFFVMMRSDLEYNSVSP